MIKATSLGMLAAIGVGAALALSSPAAEIKSPSSVSESAPDKTGKEAKGAAGVPTIPSKAPSSMSESGAQKATGEYRAPMGKGDSKNMSNPKTPSATSDAGPTMAGDMEKDKKDKKGKKKKSDMEK